VPRVVSLDVSKRQLKGALPADWFTGSRHAASLGASLAALHSLDASGNHLEGADHPAFAALQSLTLLDLSENSLRGDVHALRLPPSVTALNLDYNYFKGPVAAAWFAGLPNLTSLRLTGNRLNCEVPRKCWCALESTDMAAPSFFFLPL
jgi:hypothetical protein